MLVWLVTPALAAAPGWPARAARDSWFVALVDRLAPEQPALVVRWGRELAAAADPWVLDPLDTPPDPGGVPPTAACRPEPTGRREAATVQVTGRACDQIQEGSGWVVAPQVVVTNAHVVAGEELITVREDERNRAHGAGGGVRRRT